jgi:hypothetical protein
MKCAVTSLFNFSVSSANLWLLDAYIRSSTISSRMWFVKPFRNCSLYPTKNTVIIEFKMCLTKIAIVVLVPACGTNLFCLLYQLIQPNLVSHFL